MRANRTLEIGTGLFTLLGFAALFFLTTQLPASGLKLSGSRHVYHLTAAFDNIGDLKVGSPVTMAGVRLGEVDGIRFDSKQYKAVVGLRIDRQYSDIPDDSFVGIQTEGLLGGKYVGISPGGSDTFFKDGGRVEQTQSALVLEDLINKLFANFADKGSGSGGGDAKSGQGGTDSNSSHNPNQSQQGTKK